jgi:hypothetical protein
MPESRRVLFEAEEWDAIYDAVLLYPFTKLRVGIQPTVLKTALLDADARRGIGAKWGVDILSICSRINTRNVRAITTQALDLWKNTDPDKFELLNSAPFPSD